ncbi:hypothetical protein CapIbe_007394 [Capra ibex]
MGLHLHFSPNGPGQDVRSGAPGGSAVMASTVRNDELPVTKKMQADTQGREETSSWNGQSPRKTPFNPQFQRASPGKE